MMKGQIPVLEMIAVTIALFVSFSIFFPERNFGNRWQDADLSLKGRDSVTTIDRIGVMGNLTGDDEELRNFLNKTIPSNIIHWRTLDGTVQSNLIVACNCTTQQIQDLTNQIGRLKLNEREILLDIRPSTLSPIQKSNVLIIWGRTDLAPYENDIIAYLRDGGGVIGIADVTTPDSTYTKIFGVRRCDAMLSGCTDGGATEIDFRFTTNSSKPGFLVNKFFSHAPIRDLANLSTFPLAIETNQTCPNTQVFEGSLKFKSTTARYWICNSTDVFMDTNSSGGPDVILKEGHVFLVRNAPTGATYRFRMGYIDTGGNRTYMSFLSNPVYRFDDSSFKSSSVLLYPADLDAEKVVLYDGTYGNGRQIPVVTVNTSTFGRAMWSSDFLSGSSNHDKRLLMASMILSASKKKTVETTLTDLKITGVTTPYINVANRDMLEIYQFNLGLGFPF